MRVLVLNHFFLSGQTTHVNELCRGLVRAGHEVALVCTGASDRRAITYHQALRESGVEVVTESDWEASLATRSWDVVHMHSSKTFGRGLAFAHEKGIPTVITCHGLGLARVAPLLRTANQVICVGRRVAADLPAELSGRITIIENGIDTELFVPRQKPGLLHVVYAGRVDATKRKGLDALSHAVARMRPRIRFTVAGNWAPSGAHVHYVGWLTQIAPLFSAAHVVVGTGRALREGLASGCAVVVLGRAFGGLVEPQHLTNSGLDLSGLVGVPAEPGRILQLLQKLNRNREYLSELGRLGREYACRHLSLETVVARTVAVYEKAIQP